MIELFNLVNEQRKKSIKIKCNHVSYWRSESEKINELIKYIENNINEFCIETFDIKYSTVMDDEYVQAFDIVLYTNQKTYNYISNKYKTLLEKYDKYVIDLSDARFYSLSEHYKLNLH